MIDNKTALIHEMAWRLTVDKQLPEPMLAKMSDAILSESRITAIQLFHS